MDNFQWIECSKSIMDLRLVNKTQNKFKTLS